MTAFKARFDGRCASCGDQIARGDLVLHVDDELVHRDCEDLALVTADRHTRQAEVCTNCWIVRPCPCDDERRAS